MQILHRPPRALAMRFEWALVLRTERREMGRAPRTLYYTRRYTQFPIQGLTDAACPD